MGINEEYLTVIYSNGKIQQMIVTADITRNANAVNDYIRQYKPFLVEGGAVVTTGTLTTSDGPIPLGINQTRTQARFAFTWTTN
jgi:hypothetical protein